MSHAAGFHYGVAESPSFKPAEERQKILKRNCPAEKIPGRARQYDDRWAY
ncbi:MAG TPA: hypothetical protein VGI85_13005 [Chthoniobacterales bacterium]|jgi:hypothetical protein